MTLTIDRVNVCLERTGLPRAEDIVVRGPIGSGPRQSHASYGLSVLERKLGLESGDAIRGRRLTVGERIGLVETVIRQCEPLHAGHPA